jgi:hypothetical protein
LEGREALFDEGFSLWVGLHNKPLARRHYQPLTVRKKASGNCFSTPESLGGHRPVRSKRGDSGFLPELPKISGGNCPRQLRKVESGTSGTLKTVAEPIFTGANLFFRNRGCFWPVSEKYLPQYLCHIHSMHRH